MIRVENYGEGNGCLRFPTSATCGVSFLCLCMHITYQDYQNYYRANSVAQNTQDHKIISHQDATSEEM